MLCLVEDTVASSVTEECCILDMKGPWVSDEMVYHNYAWEVVLVRWILGSNA